MPSDDYQDEESTRRELRMLTEKTRKLRAELLSMVSSAHEKDLSRALIRTESWPRERRQRQDVLIAEDRRKTPPRHRR